jgi:hypothetical protein
MKHITLNPLILAEADWASKYLPHYFDKPEMIKNSQCLYAQK